MATVDLSYILQLLALLMSYKYVCNSVVVINDKLFVKVHYSILTQFYATFFSFFS